MKLVLVFLISTLLLLGCAQTETATKQPSPPEQPSISAYDTAKAQCEKDGGELIGCETLTGYACSMPTSDGGKSCIDSDECEQECVAPRNCGVGAEKAVGTCAERTHLVCNGVATLEEGRCEPITIA